MNENILQELQRQTTWLRFLALPLLRDALTSALDDDRKRRVYELTDGMRTSREVGREGGVSHVTVLRWWEQWSRMGLTQASATAGRPTKLVSLADLGLSAVTGDEPNRKER